MTISKSFRLIIPFFALAFTSACQEYLYLPSPMGQGYTVNTVKTPNPPQELDIGYDYTAEKNEEAIALWRPKVEELLHHLIKDINMPEEKIYVRSPKMHTGMLATIDHIIREDLRQKNIELVSDRYEGLILTYSATPIEYLEKKKREELRYDYNPDIGEVSDNIPQGTEFIDMLVTLSLFDNLNPLMKAEAVYTVPRYGYLPDYKQNPFNHHVAGKKLDVPPPTDNVGLND